MSKIVFLWRSDKPLFHTVPRRAALSVAIVAGCYLCACAALWSVQRSMVFHPMRLGVPAPGSAMATEGGAQFWIAKAPAAQAGPTLACPAGPDGRRGAVAYFPGNAEPASRVGTKSGALPGCDFYSLDYPGYEGAGGAPGEEAIHRASDLMMARMERDGVDMGRVVLVGRSLGSGEAVRQASRAPCRLAVLLTPYDSLASVALDYAPWAPVSLLIRDPFPAASWAKSARCHGMVVYAEDDATIDPSHAQRLHQAWNPQAGSDLSTILGATHANVADVSGVWTATRSALAAQAARAATAER